MTFEPQTVVRILKNVSLDNTYKNTISFGTLAAQTTFFTAKAKFTFTDFTYQRTRRSIRVPVNAENLWDCNYVMYQNKNFGSKYFYAFILEINYINPEMTEIVFEVDVMQTWMFDYTIKESFVEREHVSDDTIGAHIFPENLETGAFIYQSTDPVDILNDLVICVVTTATVDENIVGGLYTNIYSGSGIYAWSTTNVAAVNTFLNELDNAGKGGAVSCVFMMPKALIPNFTEGALIQSTSPVSLRFSYTKNTGNIDGYVPHNNKLFVYPYNFLQVTTFNGTSAVLQYEYFAASTTAIEFTVTGNIAPNPTVLLVPRDYKNIDANYDEAIKQRGYPLCNWSYGAFNNWLAQNAVSLPISAINSALPFANAPSTLPDAIRATNPVGNLLSNLYQHAIQPPQSRGSSADGFTVALNLHSFGLMKMTISQHYARRIDRYFDMYGYRVNHVKVPETKSRASWNYVKTVDINITGNLPTSDLDIIKSNFNKGITIWHGDYVGDYSRNNGIV